MSNKTLHGKKIAMLIAFQDFRDEEYFIPKNIFLSEGARVFTISAKKGKAVGSYGGVVDVDATVDRLDVNSFDAVVFVGGSGAAKYLDDEKYHKIIQDTIAKGKLLAAICIASTILARSGVLKGKKATVWSGKVDKSPIKILKEGGAIYQEGPVVVDGSIITANGPLAARKFAETIVRALT